jgi:hypothetical protein
VVRIVLEVADDLKSLESALQDLVDCVGGQIELAKRGGGAFHEKFEQKLGDGSTRSTCGRKPSLWELWK